MYLRFVGYAFSSTEEIEEELEKEQEEIFRKERLKEVKRDILLDTMKDGE